MKPTLKSPSSPPTYIILPLDDLKNADLPNFQIHIHTKEITLQKSFRLRDKQHNWH